MLARDVCFVGIRSLCTVEQADVGVQVESKIIISLLVFKMDIALVTAAMFVLYS